MFAIIRQLYKPLPVKTVNLFRNPSEGLRTRIQIHPEKLPEPKKVEAQERNEGPIRSIKDMESKVQKKPQFPVIRSPIVPSQQCKANNSGTPGRKHTVQPMARIANGRRN